jgi:hypothetical protein
MAPILSGFPSVLSEVNVKGPEYASNTEKWKPVMAQYEDFLEGCASQGSDKSQARHVSRGQLLGK